MPNQLINESSPYLLQHAHNPVNWYPWGDDALRRAKRENKPILISIGYSSCHWCHVMERESFEDEDTAALMNEHFINIKIDREERPDLDHIYMDAVQAMTGSGGWPLNVFLTPDCKPFYGGTYFPPRRAFNRPAWKEILVSIAKAFQENSGEVNTQANNLTEYLLRSNAFAMRSDEREIFSREKIDECFNNLMKAADKEFGGFGKAPKFPQTFSIQFLLRYSFIAKNEEAKRQALLSLDNMIAGGIYDQLGGGFARYSTDDEWLVPHFEKMLYDNALLVSVLSEAFQLTRSDRYRQVIEDTIGFVERELMHSEGGFYSALDADSEGEEGRFYAWTYEEVKKALSENADVFCTYFDITEAGNWEGKNILRTKRSLEEVAGEKNISPGELAAIVERGRKILLDERSKRTRPGLDDKIILGWNALMNAACTRAFAATGEEKFRQLARKNMTFLLERFSIGHAGFCHSWKNGRQKQEAFLDDYALLIHALILLQEIAGETRYLLQAKEIADHVVANFLDDASGLFFFTANNQSDVFLRKKEIYDGATPSGNSVMSYVSYQLSILFDLPDWRKRVEDILSGMGTAILNHPTSFGVWAMLLQEIVDGTQEIAVTGDAADGLITPLLKEFIPHKLIMVSSKPQENFPLLKGKLYAKSTQIFLCKRYACQKPLATVDELLKLLKYQE